MSENDRIEHAIFLLADRTMEYQAVDTLVELGIPAIPALMVALRERERWYAAATALARIGQPAIPSLIDLLQYPPFSNLAFHALMEIGSGTVPAFIAALAHPNDEVRMWAATALTHFPDHRARDGLRAALFDTDWLVRATAATAIGNLGDASLCSTLQMVLGNDADQRVREAAASACIVLEQR